MKYFYITLLILSFNVIQASIYSNLKQNVLSLLQRASEDKELGYNKAETTRGPVRYFQYKKQEDARDAKSAQNKATILKKVRTHEENLNIGKDMPSSKLTATVDKKIGREYYHMDPVLNELKRRSQSFRRQASEEEAVSSDSSLDMKFWMDEWDEHWMQKKFEALNSSEPRGDVVNMVAASKYTQLFKKSMNTQKISYHLKNNLCR